MKPLEGLRVLDLSWVVAGPVVTRALADFGAEVVRIESSTRVETARWMQPFIGGTMSAESSALYATWNAGKRGMTVNLTHERGRQIVRDLAGWADVVLEAFSPGTMKKWGLDYATLSADRPELIMVSSALNGQTGPLSSLAGYGNVGAALSGFQDIVGRRDDSPIGPYGPYTDFVAPRLALPVLLAAIDHRDRTGKGCYIDISQVESGVFFQSPEILAAFKEGRVAARMGNDDLEYVPHGVYRAVDEQDGDRIVHRYVAIAVTDESQWNALALWVGGAGLDRPELAAAEGRRKHAAEIDSAIADAVRRKSAKSVEIELQALGVPAHVSASSKDFCTDEQLAERGHLVRLPHDVFGEVTVEGPRYALSDTPGFPERAAPMLGQDNRYVLDEILHYSPPLIASLEEEEVLR